MSKLSFRARALDATKPMPVYRIEEIPDLPDFAAINRAVPQMPTGMEKEEETEHHLQRALSAQQVYGTSEALVIPVPEINNVDERYRSLYVPETPYKPPRQYIHVQPFGMEQEIPDYDMDSDDETWMSKQSKKLEVTPLKFETMMDRLEKGSGQTVMTLQEAKALLKEDDDLIIAVYDYWLNKRLTLQHALIPSVKTEKRDGSTSNNPYVAFRRRTEKMQTRKNRKNDEVSYEKMLKLRRDLKKALTILELMKRREKSKKELLKLTIEIVDKRYTMQDFDGSAYKDANAKRHTLPNTFIQSYTEYINARKWADREEQTYAKKVKRRYNKRKDREKVSMSSSNPPSQPPSHPSVHLPQYTEIDIMQTEPYTSEEENSPHLSPVSEHETEPDDPDGPYAFKRKPGCFYHAPINAGQGNWPWFGRDQGGFGDARYRYSLAALSQPKRCVGFVRRRYGRGGRVLLDRGFTDWDDQLEELEYSSPSSPHDQSSISKDYFQFIKDSKIPFFRPKSPVEEEPLATSVLDDSLSPLPIEFSMETYESHREQLLQMQRDQQESLLKQEVADVIGDLGCSYPTPACVSGINNVATMTLDSEKAQFAVSAVCAPAEAVGMATQEGGGGVTTAAVVMETARASPVVFQNGAFQVKGPGNTASPALILAPPHHTAPPGVFSTSPAANVLQLNYPISSADVSSTPSVSSHATTSGVGAVLVTSTCQSSSASPAPQLSIALPISLATKRGTQLLKIGSTAQADGITKDKHEGANNILTDKVVAMEVT